MATDVGTEITLRVRSSALLRRLADRLFAREYTRTNWYGAKELFPIGRVICGYRVTRHRIIPCEPWATYVVYARKHQEDVPE